jgi:hypothetical protein
MEEVGRLILFGSHHPCRPLLYNTQERRRNKDEINKPLLLLLLLFGQRPTGLVETVVGWLVGLGSLSFCFWPFS